MAVQKPSPAPSATPGGVAALQAIVEAQMETLGNELDRAWKKVPRDIRIEFLREQMKSKEWDGLIADARGKTLDHFANLARQG